MVKSTAPLYQNHYNDSTTCVNCNIFVYRILSEDSSKKGYTICFERTKAF